MATIGEELETHVTVAPNGLERTMLADHSSRAINLPSDLPGTFGAQAQSWDELLSHQVALLADREFAWLASQHSWQTATMIADIGCGNGDYVTALRQRFPDKSYIGVDASHELLEVARARHGTMVGFAGPNYAPAMAALTPDAAILRFVLQHLGDASSFLRTLRQNHPSLRSLFIVEPSLEDSSLSPSLNELNHLIDRRYEADAAAGRHSRLQSPELARIAGPHWTIAGQGMVKVELSRTHWPRPHISGVLYGWLGALATPAELAILRPKIRSWIDCDGQDLVVALKIWHLATEASVGFQ